MEELGCCFEFDSGCSYVAYAGANENILCKNYRDYVKNDGRLWEVGGEFEGQY